MFLMFAGFIILVAIFMRVRDKKLLSILFVFILILTAFGQSKFITFHLTILVMVIFIVFHLLRNFQKSKSLKAFLVLYSMASIMVAQLFFIMILFNPYYYIVGHVLQLIGFLMLLLNMILVFRK
jgi:hypothetical protein